MENIVNVTDFLRNKIIENGVYERYFRPEGKMNDGVCALPIESGKLRLYCNRLSQQILIAGNGDFNVKHYIGKFNAYQRTYVLISPNDEYFGVLYYAAMDKIESFKIGANGSIVKFITKGDIEKIGIFKCKQKKLYSIINTLIIKIEKINNEIASLNQQRDELLPLLINGQVSVAE